MLSTVSRPGPRATVLSAALGGVLLALAPSGAMAQSGCESLGTFLQQRKAIADSLGGGGKKKQLDARVACGGFGKLVANGNTLIKWAETNREWCRIPDSFMESVKGDHEKAVAIRTKACGMAAKMQQMERQAKQQGGGGLLGGGGLTGSTRMPQGAL